MKDKQSDSQGLSMQMQASWLRGKDGRRRREEQDGREGEGETAGDFANESSRGLISFTPRATLLFRSDFALN